MNESRRVATHLVEAALFPNWAGTSQERFYSLVGDQLELSTAPISYAGDTVTAVLVWQRL